MPPLPATFDEGTTELISSTTRLQNDLAQVQIPRLRACAGPLVLQQTYAAEVREDIETLTRKVEALDLLVWDLQGEKNRSALRGVVDGFREALVESRQSARAALLASKKLIDSQSGSKRDELLGAASARDQGTMNEKTTGDALMKAHNDVTEALRRTINLMQGELEKSVLSTQLLDSSTASLKATSFAHDTLTDLMSTSKQLITALEKTDWLDRLLILSAFVFFLLVVLFILKQRVIDRGLRIAFWWTRFLPDFSGDEKLLDLSKAVSVVPTLESVVTSDTIQMASTLLPSSVVVVTATASSSYSASGMLTSSPSTSPTSSDSALPVASTLSLPCVDSISIPTHVEL